MAVFLKRCCIAAMSILTVLSARGEPWEDWRTPPVNAPLTAELKSGWDVDPFSIGSNRSFSEYLEANRGYEGTLLVTPTEEAGPVSGPLTVQFLYSVASPYDLNWPEEGIPEGFVLQLLPGTVPGRERMEETVVLPAEFPLEVPVVLPKSCAKPISMRNYKPAALIGRYAIFDAEGILLTRGVMPLRKISETYRVLMGRTDNDEAMKRLTEKAGSTDRVGNLPDEMVAYRSIRGIWFTDSLWDKMDGREALARRLLLSGVRLSGETQLVERIRTALGTGPQGVAVAESVIPSSWSTGDPMSLRELNLRSQYTPRELCDARKEKDSSLFENEVDLFAPEKDSYFTWTIASLLVFSLGVGVLLAVGFIRFKGERRVMLWWSLPLWTLLCSLGIWGGGLLVLERRPVLDVTEYRLIMQGWPEMYCRAVASAMTFEPGRPMWTLPAGAVTLEPRYKSLNGWWARRDSWIGPERIQMQLPREMTGTLLELEAGWFEPASSPVSVESGTPEEPGRWVVASEQLDGVYVLAEGSWRELGAMRAGDRLDPLSLKKGEGTYLPGLPEEIQDQYLNWHTYEPCTNSTHNHSPPDPERIQPDYDWVVVAWQRDVPPRVTTEWDESRTKGRVIWVIQCP